ncbi:MAG: hypothetical protein U0Q16_21905 [Bryobacteraceae bacterium]
MQLLYWILGIVGVIALCIAGPFVVVLLRCLFSPRTRVCAEFAAAQQALDRRDFDAFDRNLARTKQMAEEIRDEALRVQFRSSLALLSIQGAYWQGDMRIAELTARQALEVLEAAGPGDRRGQICSAHSFLGDIFLDQDKPSQAADEFRAAAALAEGGNVPVAAIFPLQRLSDVLFEHEGRDAAAEVIERCAQIEKDHFAKNQAASNAPTISMVAPDQSRVRGDFAAAEKLFDEKVRFFTSPAGQTDGIDVTRYQLHLAEAQNAQGKIEEARATLAVLCSAEAKRFGPQHPRVVRYRRKLESIQ